MTEEMYKKVIEQLYEKIEMMKIMKRPEAEIKKTSDIVDMFTRQEKPKRGLGVTAVRKLR